MVRPRVGSGPTGALRTAHGLASSLTVFPTPPSDHLVGRTVVPNRLLVVRSALRHTPTPIREGRVRTASAPLTSAALLPSAPGVLCVRARVPALAASSAIVSAGVVPRPSAPHPWPGAVRIPRVAGAPQPSARIPRTAVVPASPSTAAVPTSSAPKTGTQTACLLTAGTRPPVPAVVDSLCRALLLVAGSPPQTLDSSVDLAGIPTAAPVDSRMAVRLAADTPLAARLDGVRVGGAQGLVGTHPGDRPEGTRGVLPCPGTCRRWAAGSHHRPGHTHAAASSASRTSSGRLASLASWVVVGCMRVERCTESEREEEHGGCDVSLVSGHPNSR
jgi:hypothetical protein